MSLETRTGVPPVEFVLIDGIYGHAMDPDPELRARCRAMYLDAASVCAELGTVTEIEYEYGARNPLPVFHPFQKLDAGQKDQFLDFYREMLAVVEGTEGRVLLEPINRYECRYLNLVSDNLEIIAAVDHPTPGCSPTPSTCRSRRPTSPRPSELQGIGWRTSTSETTTGSCRVMAASSGRRSSARSTRSGSRPP